MKVSQVNPPEYLLLKRESFDYADSFVVSLNGIRPTIEQVGKSFFTTSPAWIAKLLLLRDKVGRMIGLKTAGDAGKRDELLAHFRCEVGERIALFHVLDKNENEVIFGEDDKHLNFRVSLYIDKLKSTLTVTTFVKRHNWLGKTYFLFVKPFHKIIVPSIMRSMINQLQKDLS